GDGVALFIPRGEIERVRLGFGGLKELLLLPAGGCRVFLRDAVVFLLLLALLDDLSEGEVGVAGLHHAVVIEHAAVLHLLVRRLDEAVLVDARIARERGDEADVRTFRRLDRADAAVVRRMDVADFESGALAGQTARSEGRQTPLVRDFGQRIRLIHELRELRGTEELLDRRDDGLGVDQVVRHGRVDVLMDRHLLFDGALHAHEADAELVLEQLADCTDAAVTEVVDVIDAADVLAQAEQVVDDDVEIFRRHGLLRDRRLKVELDVELEASDAREVVLAGVEEHAFEERLRGLESRRIARTHAAVDLDDRGLVRLRGVFADGVEQDVRDEIPLREEDFNLGDVVLAENFRPVGRNVLAGLEEDFASVDVDD